MSWIPITIDTLNEAKVAALVSACSTAAKAVGQADRAAGLIAGVVMEIRRKVESCKTNRVDADPNTIPAGLRDLAVDMIVARLKNAIEDPLTDDEAAALRNRQADLNRIASCIDVVDSPDNPIPANIESGVNSPAITPRHRRFTHREESGV